MKKILSLLVISLLCIIGCNNDDDKNTTVPALQHTWTLISAGGGFAGVDYEYEEGVIKWKFKADGTVEVVNNNQDENKPDPLDSGTYDYDVVANTSQIEGCPESMHVDTYTFYCYTIDAQGRLILDDSPVDGLKYTFVRADLEL
jgi:hypothetical protein